MNEIGWGIGLPPRNLEPELQEYLDRLRRGLLFTGIPTVGGTLWGWKGSVEGNVPLQDYDTPLRLSVIRFGSSEDGFVYAVNLSWEQISTAHGERANLAAQGPTLLFYLGESGTDPMDGNPAGDWAYKYLGSDDGSVVITDTNGYNVDFSVTAALSGYVPTTRNINTTSPLAGGGNLSADRTLTLAGLSSIGTATYMLRVNAGATAWEYRSPAQVLSDIGAAALSHTHPASDIVSGQLALARGGTNADLSATGGTGQFLRQSSAGAAITVSAIAHADLGASGGTGTKYLRDDMTWQTVSAGVTDHGALTGLGDDDHTQYALLAGRSGGQALIGGTASGDDLTLRSTSHATKGNIFFGSGGTHTFNEATGNWGLGIAVPTAKLHVKSTSYGRGTGLRLGDLSGDNVCDIYGYYGLATCFRFKTKIGFRDYDAGLGFLPGQEFEFVSPTDSSWTLSAGYTHAHLGSNNRCFHVGGSGPLASNGTEVTADATYNWLKLISNSSTTLSGGGGYGFASKIHLNYTGVGIAINSELLAARALEVRSTSAQIRGSYDATNYWEIGCDLNGNLAITGGGTAANSIQIGRGSGTPGASSTILGTSANAAGTSAVAIGRLASAAGGSSVAVGVSASTGANNGAICIGESATNTGANSVAIGRSASAAANEFVSGNPTFYISNVYFGSGATAASPVAYTLNGSGGSGTNIAGGALQIAGGKGTGNAAGGSVKIQASTAGASGTTLQTLATVAEFGPATIGFYGVTPVARPTAYTQTYSTADRTLAAYTADNESAAYTGIDNAQVGTVYAQLTDLNAIRTAYENLRAFVEDIAQMLNSVTDDLQAVGLLQ